MKLQTHTPIMITAEIANANRLDSEMPAATIALIVKRCNDLAQEIFESGNVTSQLIDSGIFAVLCPDGTRALAAAASLMSAVEAKSRPAKICLRMAVHLVDYSHESISASMGSLADARYANLLRRSAHGGQILISARAYDALHNALPANMTLRDLGQHQLADLSQPAHVFQLVTPERPQAFPSVHSMNGSHHNLATPVSRFIGREDDMEAIRAQFVSNRMVTLVGAPGIGKTRLAVQTAAIMVEEMADGAWFVEIPLLSDSSLVVPAIAAALQVVEDPATSLLESVVCAIEHKQLLLVLDNCDVLRLTCAATIETILDRCPGVRVLASGAEPIGVQGEAVHSVRSLTLPTIGPVTVSPMPDLDASSAALLIRSTEAGELFNDHAIKANPEFVLTRANAPFVTRLINAAGGVPFALQVVAHAVRVLDVGQMAAELETRIGLITPEPSAYDPNSYGAVVRTIVEWSYGQLDAPSQAVLCRLSLFNGPFTQAAMQAVSPGGRESTRLNDASVMMNTLTASGLVSIREQSGVPRYRLPDPVRDFVSQRLDAADLIRSRKWFVEYYLRLVEDSSADLEGTGAARMALWLEKEYPNLCAALAWCQKDPEQAATGFKLAQALCKYWEVRGYPGEGQALVLGAAVWGDRAERSTARSDALKRSGDLAYHSGNLPAARAQHQEALSINRELGDRARQAINLHNLGNVARAEGDHGAAQRLHEEALRINIELGDRRREAQNLHNVANALRDQGEVNIARGLYEEAIAINMKLEDHMGIGHNLNSLARLAFARGDKGEALRLYEEALTHFRTGGNQEWVAHNLAEIAKLHLRPVHAVIAETATA